MSRQIAVFGSWKKLMNKEFVYKNKKYQSVVTYGYFKHKGFDYFYRHSKDLRENIIIIGTKENEIENLHESVEKVYFYNKNELKTDTIDNISLPNMKLYDNFVDTSKYN